MPDQRSEGSIHLPSLTDLGARGKHRSGLRGFALLETTIAMSVLALVGLVMLKLSLNILSPRQATLQQTLSDAYMTYERAYAERIPFNELTGNGSPWPDHPAMTTSQVEIGHLPGGTVVTGTLNRTRLPSEDNYPIAGGTGTELTNPASMNVWKVQSILVFRVGTRTYAKSRTVIRSQ